MSIKVLAIDLEGTLISNAVSQIPRPGLFEFLEMSRELVDRLVIFTTVKELTFREIASLLSNEKSAPEWFANVDYVAWEGKTKNLTYIENAHVHEILLLDDMPSYIHPGQHNQWVEVTPFSYPYSDSDKELLRLSEVLKDRIS